MEFSQVVAPGTAQIVAPVDAHRRERERVLGSVEDRMRQFLADEVAYWSTVDSRAVVPARAVSALIEAGGKRLRPAFCLTGFLAAGGDAHDRIIIDPAVALELLHASALIHDDVLDASSLRRGEPTTHIRYTALHRASGWRGDPSRFGENVAILAGNLALVYADRLMERLPHPAFGQWAELRSELMVGQYLDVAVAAEGIADPALSRWVAVCKSGRYTIHRPLVLGATIAGRPDLAVAFEEYGQALGEAFQLRDDLIGAFGDTAITGKPAGLDLEQRKMTLLLALAAERDERVRAVVAGNGNVEDPAAQDAAALRGLLVDIGVQAEVESHIGSLVERAHRAIEAAPVDPSWQRELSAMAIEVAYRDT